MVPMILLGRAGVRKARQKILFDMYQGGPSSMYILAQECA